MANTCSTIKAFTIAFRYSAEASTSTKCMNNMTSNMNDADVNLFRLTRLLIPVACWLQSKHFSQFASVSSVSSCRLNQSFALTFLCEPHPQKSEIDFRRFPSSLLAIFFSPCSRELVRCKLVNDAKTHVIINYWPSRGYVSNFHLRAKSRRLAWNQRKNRFRFN